ncbi:MAG: NTP transferase domain-containing protein, partial [Fermentimonas sp.]|nr:NTP transferase domain-containing protein [Fermentimonas sp.]
GLKDICGRPLLGHIIDRLRSAVRIDEIVIITTSREEDRPLIEFAISEGIHYFAYTGDPEDVVGRITAAGGHFDAEIIVQVSGDCPLIHPSTIDKMIATMTDKHAEFCTIDNKKTIHEGVCVFTREAWGKIDHHSVHDYQRQSASGCLIEYPDIVTRAEIIDDPMFYKHKYRIVVDTQADLDFIRVVYARLYKPGTIVDLEEVIKLLEEEPALQDINSNVRQKGLHDISRKIIFRLDAGMKEGMGHLVRCLALAKYLQEQYFCGSYFVVKGTAVDEVVSFVYDSGFNIKHLPMDTSIQDELSVLANLGLYFKADGYILDMKDDIPIDYIDNLKQLNTTVIAIDNFSSGCQRADIVVMSGLHHKPGQEWNSYQGKLVYGADFTIIRPEFSRSYNKVSWHAPRLIVSIGGSDDNNISEKVVHSLVPLLPEVSIAVITGRLYKHGQRLLDNYADIKLFHDISDPAPIMAQADLGITSYGVTLYEFATLGIPTLLINPTRFHTHVANEVLKYGFYYNMGYFADLEPENICNEVRDLIKQNALLSSMSDNARKLFDGRGIQRVADLIIENLKTKRS